MKTLSIGTGMTIPAMAVGCWRMSEKTNVEAQALIGTALELGLNFFDHADIYGGGASEERFGAAVHALGVERSQLLIQSKCGIRAGYYDFSKAHILNSVEESLHRSGTDYLDFLLLHRPDTLMEPDEVAEAFSALKNTGKVRFFGVSNFNPMQLELLQQATSERLMIDQLQFGVAHTGLIDADLNVNIRSEHALVRDGGALAYCRLKGILIQAWSPLQYGMFEGLYWNNPAYAELTHTIDEIAADKGVTRQALSMAWIMRHPAHIQPICGTTTPSRLRELAKADEVVLTREEWYRIYQSAGNPLP